MTPQWSTGEHLWKFNRRQGLFTSIEQRPITDAKIDNNGANCCQKRKLTIIENAEVVNYLN